MAGSARTFVLQACTLVVGVAIAGNLPGAAAQPAKAPPRGGGDLRAVCATPVEIAEGKRVAETSCARCHGANGISATKGVPHLAGQRAVYLHLELRAYQSGARDDTTMTAALRRARALHDVLLPETERTLHDLEARLEELEQEEAVWVRQR